MVELMGLLARRTPDVVANDRVSEEDQSTQNRERCSAAQGLLSGHFSSDRLRHGKLASHCLASWGAVRSTGSPAARHSGKPSSKRRALKPSRRNTATAS